jgi:hypothetical protein
VPAADPINRHRTLPHAAGAIAIVPWPQIGFVWLRLRAWPKLDFWLKSKHGNDLNSPTNWLRFASFRFAFAHGQFNGHANGAKFGRSVK